MSTIPSEVHKSEIATITDKVAILRQEAEAIAVINQDDYTNALLWLTGVRAYKKNIGFRLDAGIDSAKNHYHFLREEKAKHIRPLDELDKAVSARASAWREQERLAAEAEQKRLNEERQREAREEAERARIAAEKEAARQEQERKKEIERARKAGEFGKRDANRLAKEATAQAEIDRQAARAAEETARVVKEVKVKPAIPKMAGIKGRTNWKFRIVSPLVIPHAFLMPDEVRIGAHVRSVKNKELAESDIPGIEVWSEDSV